MQSQPTRRLPVRAENQDGPWTVSVAETPHEPNSYSIYIKSECLSVIPLSRAHKLPASLPPTPSSIRSHTRPHFHSNGFYVRRLYANPLAIL